MNDFTNRAVASGLTNPQFAAQVRNAVATRVALVPLGTVQLFALTRLALQLGVSTSDAARIAVGFAARTQQTPSGLPADTDLAVPVAVPAAASDCNDTLVAGLLIAGISVLLAI